MPANRVSSSASRVDLESNPEFNAGSAFDLNSGGLRVKKISEVFVCENGGPIRDGAQTCAPNSRSPRVVLQPLARRDALVEFFAHSKESSRILGLLFARRKPVGYVALMDEFHDHETGCGRGDDLPDCAICAVLSIMRAAGIVRLTRHGFSITEVGREVYQRMEHNVRPHLPEVRAGRPVQRNGRHGSATLSGPTRPALWELRNRAHTTVDKHKRALL